MASSEMELDKTTSSLSNAAPVDEEKETNGSSSSQVLFKSQTLSTILEEPDYSLLNTLGRPWNEGNEIESGITRVTKDEQFSSSLLYDIIATCLVRAFVQLSLPTEEKHPRWTDIGFCLRYCVSNIKKESDNIWVHITPNTLGIISSMHLQLGSGGIKLSPKSRPKRGDNALLQNQKTSDFQQTIQKLISKWLEMNPDLSDRGESQYFFKKHVLISVVVESPIPSSHEQIPLSFPVALFGRSVVLQTFAASYTSNSPHNSDPHLKIISRTTSEYNYGRYFLVDSDGHVERDNISIEGTCTCHSPGTYSLNQLFFIESCSQPSVYIQYTLKEEILFFFQKSDLRGSDLYKFVTNDEVWIEGGIIGAFMNRISSAFVDHPRYKFNILLPLDFDLNILLQLSEEDAFVYLERELGAYDLDENTIIHLVVNVDFLHWIYCAAVFSNSTIYLCDSLSKKLTKKGAPTIDTNPVYIKLCKVLGLEFERRRRASKEWNKVNCEKLMQQSEYLIRRCGVYCMVFLLRGFLEGIHCDHPFENFNLTDFNTYEDPNKTSFSNKFYSVLKEGIYRVIVGSISVRDFVSFFADIHKKPKIDIYAKHELQKYSNFDFQCQTGWLPEKTYNFISNN
jgi:hypothetical protein